MEKETNQNCPDEDSTSKDSNYKSNITISSKTNQIDIHKVFPSFPLPDNKTKSKINENQNKIEGMNIYSQKKEEIKTNDKTEDNKLQKINQQQKDYYSITKDFKNCGKSERIEKVPENNLNKKRNEQKEKKDSKFIRFVHFEELGLAERSLHNPLKIIHYYLEKDGEEFVPFLGVSNWQKDALK